MHDPEITSEGQDIPEDRRIEIRQPRTEDGKTVWELVRASGTLDENSMYLNLLQCSHFAKTCAIAEMDGEAVGWVSAYIPPEEPRTLFVWQICVSEKARGKSLARRLVNELLARPACRSTSQIKTTITPDNQASWALFEGLARRLDAGLSHAPHFGRDTHFGGSHDTEHLLTIGPLSARTANDRAAAGNPIYADASCAAQTEG